MKVRYLKNSFILGAVFCLLIFIGCGEQKRSENKQVEIYTQLKVLDINVWSGLDYKGYLWVGRYETDTEYKARYHSLIENITTLDPDIITVHEANKLPNYICNLANDLDMDAIHHLGVGGVRFGPVGLPWNLREGDAILAKKDLNLEFVDRVQISGGYVGNFASFHFEDANQVIAGRVILNDQILYIFTTHWHASVPDIPEYISLTEKVSAEYGFTETELNEALKTIHDETRWRVREADGTINFVQKIAGNLPYLLTGDFNSTPEMEELKKVTILGLIDTYRVVNPSSSGYTWHPGKNSNILKYYNTNNVSKGENLYDLTYNYFEKDSVRIDYIFLHPIDDFLTVYSSDVSLNKKIGNIHPSDHFGVFTIFNVSDYKE
tara:strand:- start:9710 stop:10843 length:1134 start_codon:yes stop_codon:yes gene_type:complete